MLFGAVFTALAALLSKIRPRSSSRHGRRGRGRRRIWRRRRNHYRSRPQRGRPQRRNRSERVSAETDSARQATMTDIRNEAAVQDAEVERRESMMSTLNGDMTGTNSRNASTLDVSVEANRLENDVGSTSTVCAPRNGMLQSVSSVGSAVQTSVVDCRIPEDAASPREMTAPGCSSAVASADSGDLVVVAEESRSQSEAKSLKSVGHSKKCLEASSGLTNDSGYTERSVNSIKPRIAGDISENIIEEQTTSNQPDDHMDKPKLSVFDLSNETCCAKEDVTGENVPEQVESVTSRATTGTKEEEGVSFPSDTMDDISAKDRPLVMDVEKPFSPAADPLIVNNDLSSTTEVDTDLFAPTSDEEIVALEGLGEKETGNDGCGEGKVEKKSSRGGVYDRAEENGIALDGIRMTEDGYAVVGILLVHNDCYEKRVGVRHSTTGWTTYQDTLAGWVESVEEGEFDRFEFRVELPESGSYCMELAFFCNQYWDNNERQNHIVSRTMLWED